MTTHRKSTPLAILLAGAAVALVLAVYAQGNASACAPQEGAADEAGPVLDYPRAGVRNAGRAAEGKRPSLRADMRPSLRADRPIAELPPGVEPLPVAAHWWVGLPPLPAAQSDAVIRGEVVEGQALLDEDGRGIYSLFSVRIAEAFKGGHEMFAPGLVVAASRPGGAVRFPSGKVQRYRTVKQGFPRRGGHYVLFLKRDDRGQFSILTGYELRAGRVLPLDGDDKDPRGDLQFSRYRGADEDSFLRVLREAAQPPPPARERR